MRSWMFNVRLYASTIGPDFISMDDNASPHGTGHVTNEYLKTAAIERIDWPIRSPDLDPVEHAWDMLQTAISARSVQPNTVQVLQQALLDEYTRIPQQSIQMLISRMRRKCRPVIQSNGRYMRC